MAVAAARWERWVNAPRQERARTTFERVLDEGAALLREAGFEGFSVGEVCRRARVAPGTLYGRVENKESLFLALHDRELHRITATGLAAIGDPGSWDALSTPDVVDRVVLLLGRHYADERALLRVFILRAAVDRRVRDEGAYHVSRLEQAVVDVLVTRRDDYPHPDPRAAVLTATHLALDSLSWRTAFGADFRAADVVTDTEWTRRLQHVCRSFLLTGPAR